MVRGACYIHRFFFVLLCAERHCTQSHCHRYNDKRTPSWTDRILWRGFTDDQCYQSRDERETEDLSARQEQQQHDDTSGCSFAAVQEIIASDHEPVYCVLDLQLPSEMIAGVGYCQTKKYLPLAMIKQSNLAAFADGSACAALLCLSSAGPFLPSSCAMPSMPSAICRRSISCINGASLPRRTHRPPQSCSKVSFEADDFTFACWRCVVTLLLCRCRMLQGTTIPRHRSGSEVAGVVQCRRSGRDNPDRHRYLLMLPLDVAARGGGERKHCVVLLL